MELPEPMLLSEPSFLLRETAMQNETS